MKKEQLKEAILLRDAIEELQKTLEYNSETFGKDDVQLKYYWANTSVEQHFQILRKHPKYGDILKQAEQAAKTLLVSELNRVFDIMKKDFKALEIKNDG